MQKLRVLRLTETAKMPSRADAGAIGYDLYADEAVEIPCNYWNMVKTGIAVEIPAGCYGRIAPRSGLAVNFGIDVLAGVVDKSYRGEVVVVLQNHGGGFYAVKPGQRIAQLILERAETPEIEEIKELTATERGSGGFGSTGV